MRLRSANRGNSNNTWYVNSDGNVNNNNAINANRCAPDCVIFRTYGCPVRAVLPPIKHKESISVRKENNTVAMLLAWKDYCSCRRRGPVYIFMDMEEIIGFDALYESMHKCKRHVMWKGSVAHFVLNGVEETYKLSRELKNGTYKARSVTKFTITKPKKREIISVSFRDRVYQRSLNDNVLYPTMTRSFIRDNWACQKGRGTDDARDRVKVFLQRMYRKYGTDFYVLQTDIHGYYPNMRHDVTNEMLRKKLSSDVAERAISILDGQYAGDIGYDPGSQMVQIVGISLMNDADHRMKEYLGLRTFGRYMDDSMMFHQEKEYLEHCRKEIRKELSDKGLTFNEKKTRIFKATDGFVLLGFKYRLTETGKVIKIIDPKNVKERRRMLKKLVRKAKRGELTKKMVDESYYSWRAHAKKGRSFKLLQRMDKYYKSLWR